MQKIRPGDAISTVTGQPVKLDPIPARVPSKKVAGKWTTSGNINGIAFNVEVTKPSGAGAVAIVSITIEGVLRVSTVRAASRREAVKHGLRKAQLMCHDAKLENPTAQVDAVP